MIGKRASRLALALALAGCAQAQAATVIEVAKSPTCGCCTEWVARMTAAGFAMRVSEVADTTPVARAAGVPDDLRSCHTAKVGGYAIEGHVPADDIRRLLREKPEAIGLSVPGMPLGSPGMEQGGQVDSYQVVLIHRDGKRSVWSSYKDNAPAHVH